MDLVLTLVFYGCAVLALAGTVVAALAAAPAWRLLALLGVAVGAAGLLLSLSAPLAAAVALVALAGAAVVVAGDEVVTAGVGRAAPFRAALAGADLPTRLGAAGVVLLLAVLLVMALGGGFASHAWDGSFASAGRVLFGRDAVATEAVGACLLVALAAGAAAWSRRP